MPNQYLRSKKVLVTGGTGLIGIPLVRKLEALGSKIRVVSMDEKSPFSDNVEFFRGDLCEREFARKAVCGMDVVFHLAGIKGGIGVAYSRAASFLVKNILMNIEIMEAAREALVDRFLYVSSVCVYPPAEIFREENAGTGLPHPSDKFGGVAKLVGEMQIEAYKHQYGLKNFLVARPTNTYGPYDNFNSASALIIPALIYRIFNGENPLVVWGDGTAVRDFVYCDDVADFLILMVLKNTQEAFNVGSGEPLMIKTVVEIIVRNAQKILGKKIDLQWDLSRVTGEKYRVTSIEKAKTEMGWSPGIDFETGILKTIQWYQENKSHLPQRYTILS